jgi:hypothetical protein
LLRAKAGERTWPLHSFCIGLSDSPDLAAAQKVADFLGTEHHNYTFTVAEALDAVSEAIYHMETYDVTTIRAGTPMFLIARKYAYQLLLLLLLLLRPYSLVDLARDYLEVALHAQALLAQRWEGASCGRVSSITPSSSSSTKDNAG